ncbi:MAG: GFA family protein [Myxococcota bacterium]
MTTGSCLCGGVAFRFEGGATPIQFCHARRCQKLTGSVLAPEFAVDREAFSWVRGEDLLTHYEAPLLREPPAMLRSFCRVCGSPMPVRLGDTKWMMVLAGVLDDEPEVRPFRRIFTDDVPDWLAESDTMQAFPGRPPANQRL